MLIINYKIYMNIQEKNSWVIKIEESNKMMIKIRMIYKIKNEKN
jgi:hypothetical protein